MRIVAIGTHHLADLNRMGRSLITVGTLLLVAGIANLGLRLFHANLVDWVVHYVAIVTGHIIDLVLRTAPIGTGPTFMTGLATVHAVGTGTLVVNTLLKHKIGCWAAFARFITTHVGSTLAVARRAGWRTGIAPYTMLGLVD